MGLDLSGDELMSPTATKWFKIGRTIRISSIISKGLSSLREKSYRNAYWIPVLALEFTKPSLLYLYFRVFGVKYRIIFGVVIFLSMALVVAWILGLFFNLCSTAQVMRVHSGARTQK